VVRPRSGKLISGRSTSHQQTYSFEKTQKEQNIAASQSSLLNKAYQTLRSPLERAEYLLSLEGIPLEETEKLDEKEFIMEIMEAREELEDATSVEDVEAARAANKGISASLGLELSKLANRFLLGTMRRTDKPNDRTTRTRILSEGLRYGKERDYSPTLLGWNRRGCEGANRYVIDVVEALCFSLLQFRSLETNHLCCTDNSGAQL
jgi:Fe-S protein assembly co-chaperone HscB